MKKIIPYVILVLLLMIDQGIKWFVLSQHHFFIINPGFIFGLGRNVDLFLWVSCIIIVVLFLLTFKRNLLQTYNLFIILAAALGNLTDRIFRGGVVDYWQINYFGINLSFNLADIILILGVFIYAWQVGKENNI